MHVPTLMLLNITVSAVMGLALVLTTLRRHRELTLLAAALGTHATGYFLLSLRGRISDLVSIIVANTLVALTLALLALAVYCFQRRAAPRLLVWLPVALTAVSFSWFLHDFQMRVLLSGVLVSVQLVIVLVPMVLRQHATVGRGQYVAMLGFLLALAAMVVRVNAILSGTDQAPSGLFDSSSASYSLIFFGTQMAILLIAIGMILMVQERTQFGLNASESQYRQLIELAQEGVAVLGHEQVLFVNDRLGQLLGVSASHLKGASFLDYICPEDQSFAMERYRARINGEVDQEAYDMRLLVAGHGPRWFRISGVRIQWNGEPATLSFISDIHDRKLREDTARQLAYHDDLTGLPNRRLLIDRIEQALAEAERHPQHLALLYIDLDKLKVLNDVHGHQAGDRLLEESARRLASSVRETDTVARLGGDEFVVLLQALDENASVAQRQAHEVARKIMAALKEPYRLSINVSDASRTEEHLGSGSLGIHVFRLPTDPVEVLLQKADAAMYAAKQQGPGRVEFSGSVS